MRIGAQMLKDYCILGDKIAGKVDILAEGLTKTVQMQGWHGSWIMVGGYQLMVTTKMTIINF